MSASIRQRSALATIALTAAAGSLTACSFDVNSTSNTSKSSQSSQAKPTHVTESKPNHDSWQRVWSNDSLTTWRCAGTNLLIRRAAQDGSADTVTTQPDNSNCIDASHPAPTVG